MLSLFNSEMICIFPYFCPYEIIVREIRESLFLVITCHFIRQPCRFLIGFSCGVGIDIHGGTDI